MNFHSHSTMVPYPVSALNQTIVKYFFAIAGKAVNAFAVCYTGIQSFLKLLRKGDVFIMSSVFGDERMGRHCK